MYEIAVVCFIAGFSSQILLKAIREDRFNELVQTLPKIDDQDEMFNKLYSMAQEQFISMLVKSYNNPVPSVPMDVVVVVSKTNSKSRKRTTNDKTLKS